MRISGSELEGLGSKSKASTRVYGDVDRYDVCLVVPPRNGVVDEQKTLQGVSMDNLCPEEGNPCRLVQPRGQRRARVEMPRLAAPQRTPQSVA